MYKYLIQSPGELNAEGQRGHRALSAVLLHMRGQVVWKVIHVYERAVDCDKRRKRKVSILFGDSKCGFDNIERGKENLPSGTLSMTYCRLSPKS
jgi:hypothetical protein